MLIEKVIKSLKEKKSLHNLRIKRHPIEKGYGLFSEYI